MIDAKLQKKYRAAAAKLSRPKPVELPSGMFRCQVMVNGRRLSVIEADPTLAHTKARAMAAGLISPADTSSHVTLDEAIKNYMQAGDGVLSPSTVRAYETIRKNRFPELMKMDVHQITRLDVQRAVSNAAKTLSSKTIANSYGLVCSVLKDYGVEITGVKLPQKKKKKRQYLSTSEIVRFIDAARGDSCEIPILLAVWLGMRRSEICGLCWDCVNYEKKIIEVKRSFVPGIDHKYTLRDETKTEGAQRVISCPDYILEKIKALPQNSSGRIFTMNPETLRRHVHACCTRAGITDTTVHGLRHTNAAVMVTLSVVDKYAMARGGWTSNKTFREIYAYTFPEAATAADEKINAYFEDALGLSE